MLLTQGIDVNFPPNILFSQKVSKILVGQMAMSMGWRDCIKLEKLHFTLKTVFFAKIVVL